MKKSAKSLLLSIIIILFFTNCRKTDDSIPNKQVSIKLFASDPEFNKLNVIGGWVYLSGGSRGIVAYRKSMEEVTAFDRHCPYQPSNPCGQVSVDASGIIALDSCCNSSFVLTDGSVSSGPATQPLLQYQTSFDGSILYITN